MLSSLLVPLFALVMNSMIPGRGGKYLSKLAGMAIGFLSGYPYSDFPFLAHCWFLKIDSLGASAGGIMDVLLADSNKAL